MEYLQNRNIKKTNTVTKYDTLFVTIFVTNIKLIYQ